MTERYLYGTAVPVLLDGGRLAGRVALYLYTRHGLHVHWFGRRRHLLTAIYAQKHMAPPYTEENDRVILRLLKAFARESRHTGGILALIPCSPAACGFLSRVGSELNEDYTLLKMPDMTSHPLSGLVRNE